MSMIAAQIHRCLRGKKNQITCKMHDCSDLQHITAVTFCIRIKLHKLKQKKCEFEGYLMIAES